MRAPRARRHGAGNRLQRRPAAQARAFEKQGFDYLHVVDLDGAFAGQPMNAAAVERILAIGQDEGAARRRRARHAHRGRLARKGGRARHHRHVGAERPRLRARGRAAVSRPRRGRHRRARRPRRGRGLGAARPRCRRSTSAASSRMPASPRSSIPTSRATACCRASTSRQTVALAEALTIPVIASGGLASIDDVRRLLEPDCARLAGAISGRALYDGRLDPCEALALIRGAERADA